LSAPSDAAAPAASDFLDAAAAAAIGATDSLDAAAAAGTPGEALLAVPAPAPAPVVDWPGPVGLAGYHRRPATSTRGGGGSPGVGHEP